MIDPIFASEILRWTRFHSDSSTALYRTWSGADKIDAEMHRLVARALRAIYRGDSLESATACYRAEWKAFQDEMNRKVDAAPKLKYGPNSGHSVISYRHAAPCLGDQGAMDIARHYHQATETARAWEKEWGEI